MFVLILSHEYLHFLFGEKVAWWCIITSRSVIQKRWFAIFKVKVRSHIIKYNSFYHVVWTADPFAAFGWWYIVISPSVELKEWIAVFKVKVAVKSSNYLGDTFWTGVPFVIKTLHSDASSCTFSVRAKCSRYRIDCIRQTTSCSFYLFQEVKKLLEATLFEGNEDAWWAYTRADEDIRKSIWTVVSQHGIVHGCWTKALWNYEAEQLFDRFKATDAWNCALLAGLYFFI